MLGRSPGNKSDEDRWRGSLKSLAQSLGPCSLAHKTIQQFLTSNCFFYNHFLDSVIFNGDDIYEIMNVFSIALVNLLINHLPINTLNLTMNSFHGLRICLVKLNYLLKWNKSISRIEAQSFRKTFSRFQDTHDSFSTKIKFHRKPMIVCKYHTAIH